MALAHRAIPLIVRYRLTPWWVRVAIIWLLSRVVTTGLLLGFADRQASNAWTGSRPDYFSFASLWDGTWYYIIAATGYPVELPLTDDGHVGENAWAFMPAYPMLVRGLIEVTGLSWQELSVFVSLAFSFAGALMFYKLMRLVVPEAAMFAVVLLCVAPLTPITQLAYAESMHAFLLTLALYLLINRRYGWLIPVIAVMAMTRPTGLAFALALGIHVVHRWFTRASDPFPRRQWGSALGVTAFSGAMGLAWPVIAWAATGSITAYTDTELAWRAPYIGYQELVPFTPWFQASQFWMPGAFGIVIVIALVVTFLLFMAQPAARRLGTDLRAWIFSYALYLFAVFFPQSSTFRLLMPLFPMLGALALPRSRSYRIVAVVLCIVGQWAWLYACWWVNGYDWSPP